MNKPRAKKVMQLDYSDCMQYLEEKYKFKADDYAGMFTGKKGVDKTVPT